MLKSLYFKLDDQNEKHKQIIDFFKQLPKDERKIDVLLHLIRFYEYHKTNIAYVDDFDK